MRRALLLVVVPALLLAGCRDLRSSRDESLKTEQIQYPMPQGGEVVYEGHGKEIWFAYGAMNGSKDTPANGVAQAHRFEDGRFLHTIQLNILPPEDGFFYEGWILSGADRISTGHLSNHFGDARHGLRFEANKDYSAYLTVLVTLEKDDGNSAPGKEVARGSMKVTQRPK
ncbi:hypothetical protein FJZ28_04095 [Candidatus Peregrinibacteria bacterium]|nr:hypothetical protein [Candidatus Peregrinibacteria bacterium]